MIYLEVCAMNTEKYQQWLADFKQLRLPDYQQFPDLALYMDQVIQETNRYLTPILHAEVTKTMINSYVKMGLVPHPLKKKYTAEHLALIMMISVLKTSFSLDTIKSLLATDEVEAHFNEFVRIFNHEIEHLDEAIQSFSPLEMAIRAVLYKLILERKLSWCRFVLFLVHGNEWFYCCHSRNARKSSTLCG